MQISMARGKYGKTEDGEVSVLTFSQILYTYIMGEVIMGERKKSLYKFWKQKKGKLMQVKEQELTSAISGVDSALLT